jgi:hypothetical protein
VSKGSGWERTVWRFVVSPAVIDDRFERLRASGRHRRGCRVRRRERRAHDFQRVLVVRYRIGLRETVLRRELEAANEVL